MVTIKGEEEEEGAANQGWETASDGDERFEDALPEEEEIQRVLILAERAKSDGNAAYREGNFRQALADYARAVELLTDHTAENAKELCSMCHCNRAMCYLQTEEYEESVHESSKAIDLNPSYIKAFLKRAQAHEKLDLVDDALSDMRKVLEIDPGNKIAAKAVRDLEPVVAKRQEKMKEELIGKAKELGDSVLRRFGMRIDQFKAVQDPATGSYSISYQP